MTLSPYPYAHSVFFGYPFTNQPVEVFHKIAITLRILNLHLRSAYEPELGNSLPKRILRPYNQSQFSIHWLNANENDFTGDVSDIEWLKYHLTVNPTTNSCTEFDISAKSDCLHILCHNKESKAEPWFHFYCNTDIDLIWNLHSWYSSQNLQETISIEWNHIEKQTMDSFDRCSQKELDSNLQTGWNTYLEHINKIIDQTRM